MSTRKLAAIGTLVILIGGAFVVFRSLDRVFVRPPSARTRVPIQRNLTWDELQKVFNGDGYTGDPSPLGGWDWNRIVKPSSNEDENR